MVRTLLFFGAVNRPLKFAKLSFYAKLGDRFHPFWGYLFSVS
jgi:hypothetical protein